MRFLGCFSKAKTKQCHLKVGNLFYQFGITISCLATYFLEVYARVSLKVSSKGSIRDKKSLKNWIFSFFLNKNGGCHQNLWNIFNQFGSTIPCLARYFLEILARLSIKVATKVSSRVKINSQILDFKAVFPKQKRRSATKKLEMFQINLTSIYVIQLHISWKSVHALHWK